MYPRSGTNGITDLLLAAVAATICMQMPTTAHEARATQASQSADALGALVGAWQSDTTDGVSALSSCVWTPEHDAVLCEQKIRSPAGERRAINLFTFDPAQERFVFYVLSRPGDPMNPVPLSIQGQIWIYGGTMVGQDGLFHRTVNDFSKAEVYLWRQEASTNGLDWMVGARGQSRRLR